MLLFDIDILFIIDRNMVFFYNCLKKLLQFHTETPTKQKHEPVM